MAMQLFSGRKGQDLANIVDYLFVIFMFVIAIFLVVWDTGASSAQGDIAARNLDIESERVFIALLSSPIEIGGVSYPLHVAVRSFDEESSVFFDVEDQVMSVFEKTYGLNSFSLQVRFKQLENNEGAVNGNYDSASWEVFSHYNPHIWQTLHVSARRSDYLTYNHIFDFEDSLGNSYEIEVRAVEGSYVS